MSPLLFGLEAAAGVAFALLLGYRVRRARSTRAVVQEVGAHRELWLVRGRHATLQARVTRADPLVSGLAYTDGFHLWAPARGAVLFLGGGAGIGPRQIVAFHPEVRAHVVERDPAVVALAAARFGLSASDRLTLETGDGRAALERPGLWARIVIDAFGAGSFPANLATEEAFRACRARLAPGGSLVVNLAGTFHGPVLPAVHAGLVAAFGADRIVAFGVPHPDAEASQDTGQPGNTLVVAFRDGVPDAPPDAGLPDAARSRLPALPALCALRGPPAPPDAAPLHDRTAPPTLRII